MNKKINFDISKKGDTLTCRVKVPSYDKDYRTKTRLNTKNIVSYLSQNGHDMKNYKLTEEGSIHNKTNPPKLVSSWVFVKLKKEIKSTDTVLESPTLVDSEVPKDTTQVKKPTKRRYTKKRKTKNT